MPALQARRLRHALVLQVRIAQGEELVGGGTRHRVHEDREVARLRQCSLAAVAHAQCQHRADAVVVRSLRRGHHMLECPGKSSSEGSRRLAADPAVETQLVPTSRDMARTPGWSTALLAVGSSLKQVRRRLDQNIDAPLLPAKSWAETREMGPWCDMVQTGHARFPQEHCRVVQCARKPGRKPNNTSAEPAVFQVPEFQGTCPVATCEPRDQRASHTRRGSLTPPCLPAGRQQFCGPQSRQAGAVAPHRALLAPAAPGRLPRVARSGC